MITEEIQKQIVDDSHFRDFVSEVENGVKDFEIKEGIHLKSELYLENDWEMEDYKNIILYIQMEGISFKEKKILWRKLTNIINKHIKYEDSFQDFVKRFFIKLELI